MEIRCPGCAAEGNLEAYSDGQEVRCTRCGHAWVPRRRAYFRAGPGPHGRRQDYERWLYRWTITAGIWLVVGFLVPIVVSAGGGSWRYPEIRQTYWFWDMLDKARGGAVIGIVLPALVGAAALIIAGAARGRGRSIAVFCLGAGTVLLAVILASDEGLRVRGIGRIGGRGSQTLWVLLLVLSGTAIAVGNRIRKHHPVSLLPRLLAGIAGCVILLLYVLPIERNSLIEVFFRSRNWRHGWPMLLILAIILVYGILATGHFGRMRRREGLCLAVSIFGRMIVIGAPLGILAAALEGTDGEHTGMILLMALKVVLIVYGVLALLSVGLTAWLADVVAPGGSSEEGAAPQLGDLKTRLERLKSALDGGLLTPEEYEVKRKQVVDSADF